MSWQIDPKVLIEMVSDPDPVKAAKAMQGLQERWDEVKPEDLDDALRYNRQIWMMFVDTAVEDDDPERSKALRNNIANLGVFIFNRTVEVLANPVKEKLDILIEINREVAAGLMTRPKSEQRQEPARPPGGEQPAPAPTMIDG